LAARGVSFLAAKRLLFHLAEKIPQRSSFPVDITWRDEFWLSVGHADGPVTVMDHAMMEIAQQHAILQ
jgi:hypothetical protein